MFNDIDYKNELIFANYSLIFLLFRFKPKQRSYDKEKTNNGAKQGRRC